MIFYFSGTGNSLYVAKKLAKEMNCDMIDMAENRKEAHEFQLKDNEPVGFVFPVYYYTLNDVVFDFISNLKIMGNGYTFAVVTCGGSIGGTGALLKSELKKRGITLNHTYALKMPDNAVFYYDVAGKEAIKVRLEEAEKALEQIKSQIHNKVTGKSSLKLGLAKVMRPIYHKMSSTKRFSVTEECIHCGKCERNCPEQAICMKNGIAEWEKSHCVMCSACINRCPVQAIQYGKGTRKRNRYVNPNAY